ncbi:MAG TPA: hypothetical protein DCE42_22505 [Myxococcales bacterium]|nr:hypothetical protein [Deltaproteobacteria bacterium]MBU54852.1 hypothetical protein [Deltaproteobacteria bacterium]HAA57555.1 hypothetical protein [Myxococcales bacterium]
MTITLTCVYSWRITQKEQRGYKRSPFTATWGLHQKLISQQSEYIRCWNASCSKDTRPISLKADILMRKQSMFDSILTNDQNL